MGGEHRIKGDLGMVEQAPADERVPLATALLSRREIVEKLAAVGRLDTALQWAIDFDDEFECRAVEVDDESTDDVLTSKSTARRGKTP
mgnify:CR=1 FL=1